MTAFLRVAFTHALITSVFRIGARGLVAERSSNALSFDDYVARYGRKYVKGTPEYEQRRSLYGQRLEQVQYQNSKAQRRWSAAVNHLSDHTEAELLQLRGLRVMKADHTRRAVGSVGSHRTGQFLSQIKTSVLPEEKSWAHLNASKLDTNQGACGSCWAIATATMLQGNAEVSGRQRTFSAQELVNCVPNPHNCGGSGGCDGSTVELAMNWVTEKGLADSPNVPYHGTDGACSSGDSLLSGVHLGDGSKEDQAFEDMIAVGFHAPKSQSSLGVALGLEGWEKLPENEYEPLIRAVAEKGPVAVSVAANDWSGYGYGLFDGCNPDAVIDHAVTLIGYGVEKSSKEKYWLIKNSWGLDWGEGGNIRMLRKEGNVHCGTDYQPKVGTGCDGGPSSVKVCGMCGILYDSVVAKFRKV